jgi:hypothetical protein
MRRTLGIVALVLLVLASGCGGNKARNVSTRSATVTLPAKQVSTGRTSIHVYTPVTAAGSVAAGIRIGKTATGDCWTGSEASARSDAFRCMVGDYIHDPCFAAQTGSANYVLCPQYTPDAKALRIKLTKQLQLGVETGDPTRGPPWAVRTTNGMWCTILTGATGLLAGMPIRYGCTGGGVLLGNPRRSTKIWTIFYASSYKASQFRPVKLRSAWW